MLGSMTTPGWWVVKSRSSFMGGWSWPQASAQWWVWWVGLVVGVGGDPVGEGDEVVGLFQEPLPQVGEGHAGWPAVEEPSEVGFEGSDALGHGLLRQVQVGHVEHLTDFEIESFGGPAVFSEELGYAHLIDVHRGLRIADAQRERFVVLHLEAADAAGLPSDAAFRDSLRSHVEFGALVAQQNSHARSEQELHPLREVPRWTWPRGYDATLTRGRREV